MKGEFELIAELKKRFPSPGGVTGIGDDCAVIPQAQGYDTLVSTDMLVEGSHFIIDDIKPFQLGWKAAASNFSDIAAMGGSPVGSFLALALPRGLKDRWVEGFMEGYREISEKYGFPLLGGDTTSSPDRLCISVTVLGSAEHGRSVRRNGARPGDIICVTGTLGDSAAGLKAILKQYRRKDEVAYLIDRHYLPEPRMEEGARLAKYDGVHAMMDISDGIASDLRHIMEESGVGATVDMAKLPLSRKLRTFCERYGEDAYSLATEGGEDYELLFTASPGTESSLDVPHTAIGAITEEAGVLKWKGGSKDYKGFTHF